MKISKSKLYFLIKESVKKILESNGQQGNAEANLYVKITYKYRKIMSVREISDMIRDIPRQFTYINRAGEEVFKKKKAADERNRLIALRKEIQATGGQEVEKDQYEKVFIRLDALGVSRDTVSRINALLDQEGEDFLFDFQAAMKKDPHRAGEVKRYLKEIMLNIKSPERDPSMIRTIKSLLPEGGVGIELKSIEAVLSMQNLPEVYRIESNEIVVQPFYAEQNDLVRAYIPLPEDDGITEYKDEDGNVIATSEQVSMLYSLANRYQSVENRIFAASQKYAPYKVLMKLARDRNPKVRAAVAMNPKAHENHLKLLANDTSEEVMRALGMREIDGDKSFTVRFKGEEKSMTASEIETNILAGMRLQLQTDEGQYIANPERILDIVKSEDSSASARTRIRDNNSTLTPENLKTIEEWFVDKKKKAVLQRSQLENMARNIDMQEDSIKQSMVPGERSEQVGKERLKQIAIQRESLIDDFDRLEKIEAQIAQEEEEINRMKAEAEEAAVSPRERARRELEASIAARRAAGREAYQKRSELSDASRLVSRHETRKKAMSDRLADVEKMEADATSERQIELADEARREYEKSLAALQSDIRQAEQDPNYIKARNFKNSQDAARNAEPLPEPEEEKSPQRQLIDAIKQWQELGLDQDALLRRVAAMRKRLGI